MPTILLLIASNAFMTFAWYGHLKYAQHQSLALAILASWGIAFFEYCLQVPANRLGFGRYDLAQLKVMQEVITLAVFAVFAYFVMGQSFRWNHALASLCLIAAVMLVFRG